MSSRSNRLPIPPAVLSGFCRRHHIRRLALFGSTLRGEARPDSDVDLLVEFENGQAPGLLGLAGIQEELSRLMAGRRIDLRTAHDLSQYFRDDVLRLAETQYAS
jgi:predicted nucleotidyltransferase